MHVAIEAGGRKDTGRRGSILLLTLMILMAMAAVVTAFLSVVLGTNSTTADQFNRAKALYIAEAGLHKGMSYLSLVDSNWRTVWSYPVIGPVPVSFDSGTYTLWVTGATTVKITSVGTYNSVSRIVQVQFNTSSLTRVPNTWTEL
ncbi:MAG: hypothetical protein HQL19_02160 [Candidatus Omnitrophica bacterium]|nr:hypothetical protein [Candidatus Omnitrophota bacterium]